MPAININPSFPIFTESNGQPLENGYIFVGVANLDPQSNPITIYWDKGLTQPAAQPVRTSGGYPINNGSPARLYANSDFSIRVMDRKGTQVYYAPVVTDRISNLIFETALINTVDIVDSAVTTAKIADGNITNAKLASVAGNTIKANATASVTTPQDFAMPTQSFLYRGAGNIAALPILASQIVGATDAGAATTLGVGNGLTVSGSVLQARTRPAFQAVRGAQQSVTSGVATKVLFSTEIFDTNNCYDPTLARFTPNVAGQYFISAAINAVDTSGGVAFAVLISIYKNGTALFTSRLPYADNGYATNTINNVIGMNGTTDYIEIYAQLNNVTLIEAFDNVFYGWLTNIG
jgi:hypothetical protein